MKKQIHFITSALTSFALYLFSIMPTTAQVAPSSSEASQYTGLHAAAHLGHVEVVKQLIIGKAPLDHVNNLGWTALIEAVILGDGGENHDHRNAVNDGPSLERILPESVA